MMKILAPICLLIIFIFPIGKCAQNNLQLKHLIEKNLEKEKQIYLQEKAECLKRVNESAENARRELERIQKNQGQRVILAKKRNKEARELLKEKLGIGNQNANELPDISGILRAFDYRISAYLPIQFTREGMGAEEIKYKKEKNVEIMKMHFSENFGEKLEKVHSSIPGLLTLLHSIQWAWNVAIEADRRLTDAEKDNEDAQNNVRVQLAEYRRIKGEEGNISEKLVNLMSAAIDLTNRAQLAGQGRKVRNDLGDLKNGLGNLEREIKELNERERRVEKVDWLGNLINFLGNRNDTHLWATNGVQNSLKIIGEAVKYVEEELGQRKIGGVDPEVQKKVEHRNQQGENAFKKKLQKGGRRR